MSHVVVVVVVVVDVILLFFFLSFINVLIHSLFHFFMNSGVFFHKCIKIHLKQVTYIKMDVVLMYRG